MLREPCVSKNWGKFQREGESLVWRNSLKLMVVQKTEQCIAESCKER